MDQTEVQPSPNHGFSFLGSDSKISKTFPSMSVQRNAFWPDQSWIRLTFTSTMAYLQAQNVLIKHQDRSRFSTTTLIAFIFDRQERIWMLDILPPQRILCLLHLSFDRRPILARSSNLQKSRQR